MLTLTLTVLPWETYLTSSYYYQESYRDSSEVTSFKIRLSRKRYLGYLSVISLSVIHKVDFLLYFLILNWLLLLLLGHFQASSPCQTARMFMGINS